MKLSYRLTMMFVSLAVITTIGWITFGNIDFLTGQFWFIAGALLLIMLALVDQPLFSKDANVFNNSTSALVSLFSIRVEDRDGVWVLFGIWSVYLIISSFVLMAIRSRELYLESKRVQLVSRINRIIGRPESIFSAFFLWGVFYQFHYPKDGVTINALLLFWAVFMILNVPSISMAVSEYFSPEIDIAPLAGLVVAIQSPRLAIVRLNASLPHQIIGKNVALSLEGKGKVAAGILFEDKVVKGFRQGRVAITSFESRWNEVSTSARIEIGISDEPSVGNYPVGVVSAGTSIGKLAFDVDPLISLHAGEVVQVKNDERETYYQIVSAEIAQSSLEEGNSAQIVKVVAGQLGVWEETKASFIPTDWVATAGELITISSGDSISSSIPEGHCVVGQVPNSKFPVHVNLSESITHNTAIIGVTGSGKSYLAFHLIDAMIKSGVKVMILDISRQHDLHLAHHNPTALKKVEDVKTWLEGSSAIGIHQFGVDANGYPQITSEFVTAAFAEMSKTKLERGKNIPARLCVVFEEAHSLIPEWNQVANKGDEHHVNKTARVILQGRKYGMGALIITQRTANVTKTILNQCNTVFALRSFDQTGLDFLRNYMGEEYSQAISTLPRYTAILVGQASSSSRPVILKVSDFSSKAVEPPTPEKVSTEPVSPDQLEPEARQSKEKE